MINLVNTQYDTVSESTKELVTAAENENGIRIARAWVSRNSGSGVGSVSVDNDPVLYDDTNNQDTIEEMVVEAGKNLTINTDSGAVNVRIYFEVL